MQNPFTGNDPELGKKLLKRLERELVAPLHFMEVCGTHTVALFQSGLRSLLPPGLAHVSGPGCPVCVTSAGEVAFALELARKDEVILASFGDMLRVPGPEGLSLKEIKAEGARVEVCYSPYEALALAQQHRDKKVVFLGIGFETTAPVVAATLKQARSLDLENFSVFSCHKLVPPALKHLLKQGRAAVDAFLLPGHVSAIIGLEPYRFLSDEYRIPAVVAGFDPLDMLMALVMIASRKKEQSAEVQNQYQRVVREQGNLKAKGLMREVFSVQDAYWRG
ncbi:MAG: hydrogenase formation protein HypD, partial [Thermodesulfobacteriota bacterium]